MKKLTLTLMSILLVIGCTFGLVACSEEDPVIQNGYYYLTYSKINNVVDNDIIPDSEYLLILENGNAEFGTKGNSTTYTATYTVNNKTITIECIKEGNIYVYVGDFEDNTITFEYYSINSVSKNDTKIIYNFHLYIVFQNN